MGTRQIDPDVQDWNDACDEDLGADPQEQQALARLKALSEETRQHLPVPSLEEETWRREVREELLD